jgi:hypothetical protein
VIRRKVEDEEEKRRRRVVVVVHVLLNAPFWLQSCGCIRSLPVPISLAGRRLYLVQYYPQFESLHRDASLLPGYAVDTGSIESRDGNSRRRVVAMDDLEMMN